GRQERLDGSVARVDALAADVMERLGDEVEPCRPQQAHHRQDRHDGGDPFARHGSADARSRRAALRSEGATSPYRKMQYTARKASLRPIFFPSFTDRGREDM